LIAIVVCVPLIIVDRLGYTGGYRKALEKCSKETAER